MRKGKDSDIINIILIILALIIVAIIVYPFFRKEKEDFDERAAEDERLLKELEEEKTRKGIIEKHEFRNRWIQEYLEKHSKKWYKIIMLGILVLFLSTNIIVFFLVPSTKIFDLLNWNLTIVGVLALIQIFTYWYLDREKESIRVALKRILNRQFFRGRDLDYYLSRAEADKKEIEFSEAKLIELKNKRLLNQTKNIDNNEEGEASQENGLNE